MQLFNLPSRSGKEEIIEKIKVKSSNKKTTNSASTVNQRVEIALGKYKHKYKLVDNLKELDVFIDRCIVNGVVAIDTETMGLDPICDDIVGISIKTPDEKAIYIPINHITFYTKKRIESQLTVEQIAPLIQKLVDNVGTVWHNALFDLRVLNWQLGVVVNPNNIYWDTLIGAHLLNENEEHNLKYLYNKYVLNGEDEIARFGSLFKTKFNEVPLESAYIYGAHDSEMTYALYLFQYEFLNFDNIEKNNRYSGISNVFNNVELTCIMPIISMMDNGVRIDDVLSKELNIKYTALLEEAKNEFYECLKEYEDDILEYSSRNYKKLDNPINNSSPTQLAILLYDIIKVGIIEEKKPRGTGEDILEKIDLPICKALLLCRGYEKLLSTYITKMASSVNEKTGKLHCKFNPCGTVTGRFSSSGPNLQNIPSNNEDIRRMFIPQDGNYFIGSDYSQQEPRILADLSGDKHLQNAYAEGKDIYAWIASMVYKLPYEQCLERDENGNHSDEGAKRRKTLKAIVLGILYSKSSYAVAIDLNITKQEAESIFNRFFEAFPSVSQFMDYSQNKARQLGYVETAWGRKRRIPDMQLPQYEFGFIKNNFNPLEFSDNNEKFVNEETIKKLNKKIGDARTYYERKSVIEDILNSGISVKDNTFKIASAERQCVNSVIQGSAADMVKVALINIYYNERLTELGFKLVMTIHDEIIGECSYENAEEAKELLSKIMIDSAKEKISVPMKCDVEVMSRWTESI